MGSIGTSDVYKPLNDYEHPISIEAFRKLGYEVVDMICEYMASPKQQVVPNVQPGYLRPLLPPGPPQQPESFEAIKQDFYDKIMKGVLHWQSPQFFSWFSGNTSAPGILAEMLIGGLNMIGFSWQSSPVSTELEHVMMDWLAQLCGLPDKFFFKSCSSSSSSITSSSSSADGPAAAQGSSDSQQQQQQEEEEQQQRRGGGVIQGTSSEAVLVAALAARARVMKGRPAADALKLVAYGSDQAHSCFKKATMVLGLEHTRHLAGSQALDFALDPATLAAAVEADVQAGLIPFYMCATIGTTSSCAVDPVGELGKICKKYGIWLHVDAAWAGSAAILPEQRHWFHGLTEVDSYSFSCHKWLMVTFDCAAMWFEDTTYLKEALSLTPVFLRGAGNVLDYKDWQIPLGRRFRSLKLWFVMRMYGAEKLQALLRHHIALGQWFANQVAADARFELVTPPRFGLTCFRLRNQTSAANKQLVDLVNSTGEIFIVGTELHGVFTVRFAVGNSHTQLRHVEKAWNIIQQQASQVVATGKTAGATASGVK